MYYAKFTLRASVCIFAFIARRGRSRFPSERAGGPAIHSRRVSRQGEKKKRRKSINRKHKAIFLLTPLADGNERERFLFVFELNFVFAFVIAFG